MRRLFLCSILSLSVFVLCACNFKGNEKEVEKQTEISVSTIEEEVEEKVVDNEKIEKYISECEALIDEKDYVGANNAMKNVEKIKRDFYGDEYKGEDFDYSHGGILYSYDYTFDNKNGMVYILDLPHGYTNAQMGEIADKQSLGENDIVVVDYRHLRDCDLQARHSYKVEEKEHMYAIIDVLIKYDEEYPSDWQRTRDAMYNEWVLHNLSYSAGYSVERAMHVNFNNNDEASYSY